MGRAPCCDKANVKKGPWSPEEDAKLKDFIEKNGTGGNWIALPQKIGLKRCGKSCRLRWLNYLRPNIKHGDFSDVEDNIICSLYTSIGSRWSIIAAQLPGRTDNDIKNYWNTKLKKKLLGKQRKHHQQAQPQQKQEIMINRETENLIVPAEAGVIMNQISPYWLSTGCNASIEDPNFDQEYSIDNLVIKLHQPSHFTNTHKENWQYPACDNIISFPQECQSYPSSDKCSSTSQLPNMFHGLEDFSSNFKELVCTNPDGIDHDEYSYHYHGMETKTIDMVNGSRWTSASSTESWVGNGMGSLDCSPDALVSEYEAKQTCQRGMPQEIDAFQDLSWQCNYSSVKLTS